MGMVLLWIQTERAKVIELGYPTLMSGAGQWTQSRGAAKLGGASKQWGQRAGTRVSRLKIWGSHFSAVWS